MTRAPDGRHSPSINKEEARHASKEQIRCCLHSVWALHYLWAMPPQQKGKGGRGRRRVGAGPMLDQRHQVHKANHENEAQGAHQNHSQRQRTPAMAREQDTSQYCRLNHSSPAGCSTAALAEGQLRRAQREASPRPSTPAPAVVNVGQLLLLTDLPRPPDEHQERVATDQDGHRQ